MRRRYITVDVFTDRAFGGNPLAVVLDAGGLSTTQMQAIATEFNYSETTFVLPPRDPAHDAEVRIFTVNGEIPFAGHPTLGTAILLAELRVQIVNGESDAIIARVKAMARVENFQVQTERVAQGGDGLGENK